jgi:hypothetical protein
MPLHRQSLLESIEGCDFSLFGELYAVVTAFADAPENTISRTGGGRISVTDDYANHLANFRKCILEKYPGAADAAIMQLVEELDSILTRRSFGGEAFEEEFWTNEAFQRHPDWQMIREKAWEFLLR